MHKRNNSNSTNRSIDLRSTKIPKFQIAMPSINNVYTKTERVHKKSRVTFHTNSFHGPKPSVDRKVRGSLNQHNPKEPAKTKKESYVPVYLGSGKKEGSKLKHISSNTTNNIYFKLGSKPVEPRSKNVINHKNIKASKELFNDMCSARVQANTLRTVLGNDLFMLKKQVETEKQQTINFLDDIIRIADNLKKNILKNHGKEFIPTFDYYAEQINALSEQRSVLDDCIGSFNNSHVSSEEFVELLDLLKLPNKICQFPTQNQTLKEKTHDQVISCLQRLSAPTRVKKTLSSIDEYNEYINKLRDKFNVSQTDTVPKKIHNSQLIADSNSLFDVNTTHNNAKELNLTIVKEILNKNNQALRHIVDFTLDQLEDETESQFFDEEYKRLGDSAEIERLDRPSMDNDLILELINK